MGNSNKAEEKKSLKWFLIQKFMLVMIFIFISEQIIGIFYNNILIPRISQLLARQQISVTADGNPAILILTCYSMCLHRFCQMG